MFDSPARAWARIRRLLVLTLALLLVWFVLESLVYRSGFYYRWLAEPRSNAGAVTLRLARAQNETGGTAPVVLVFGDSRAGEGFSKPVAQAQVPGLDFVNLAVPGSTPRTWYYLLRKLQRRDTRFDAVVVGLPYRHIGGGELANWSLDTLFMAPLVDPRDMWTFPASFTSEEMRRRAHRTVWMPALVMQADTRALLSAPEARRQHLEYRQWWLEHASNYAGREERMPALRFDAAGQVVDFSDADAGQRQKIEQHLRDVRVAEKPVNDAFLAHWLGQVLALARAHDVPLIFYPHPRSPYPALLPDFGELPPSLAALANEPEVTVLPPDFLADLEAPDYFFDTLHVNLHGREVISRRVAQAVAQVIGHPLPDADGSGADAQQASPR